MYAYVLSLVFVLLFVIYVGEEEVEEEEQEEDHSGPFLNTATDESLHRAFCPGAVQTGIYGTEYCGASAKARLGFIREFWKLVLLLVLLLVLERVMWSAAFMDVLRSSYLSLKRSEISNTFEMSLKWFDLMQRVT